jgi:ubiquitin C-terminal hydrolase
MMKGSQVFIFGSFNEDEASSFQKAPTIGGLITLKQNDLQFRSFDSGFQCSSMNKGVSSKQASNGQVTERDDLKELNTNFNASHGGKCSIPNGESMDGISNEVKVSIGIEHETGSLISTERKFPVIEKCIPATVNKSEPLHFSNSNTFATVNDVGITSANLESSGKGVSIGNGVNKCVQDFELESSSKLMGNNTMQQLQHANDDTVEDAVEDPNSLLVNIPLSWAARFGSKAGNGQVSYSQNGDKGRSKFGKTSTTAKAYHGNASNSSLASLTSNASGGTEITMKRLQPRGLVNTGNLCFLNAIVQALLSCSPFFQLLQTLKSRDIPEVGYTTLHAFVKFVVKFEEDEPIDTNLKKNVKATGGIEVGQSFCPTMFDAVLKSFSPDQPLSPSGSPRQEDAQEFLGFVMDRLHDELLKLEGRDLNASGGRKLSAATVSGDDDWETVGPKNRTAITRTQTFMESELSAIFGGQLRSVVKSRGNKASATVQPFMLLPLDILPDAVHTVEDALHLFASPESLEGYRVSAGKAGVVSASKAVKLQTLPKVLILHLMRFSFGSAGSGKLHKPVTFSPEIVLSRELLVSPTTEGRRYELVATVSHHGRDPSKGHYTADTKHPDGQWLRFDDAAVSVVGLNKVLHDQAYLLFYKQI